MSDKQRIKLSSTLHTLLLLAGMLSVILYALDVKKQRADRLAFADALAAAQAGRWYLDLTTDELRWDDQMFVLFGKSKADWEPSYGGFEECLLPEDRAHVRERVETAIKTRGGYNDVFTIVRSDGTSIAIRTAALVSRGGTYMTGLCLPAVVTVGNFNRSIGRAVPMPPAPTAAPEFWYTPTLPPAVMSAMPPDVEIPALDAPAPLHKEPGVLGPPTQKTLEDAAVYSDARPGHESEVYYRN